MGSLHHIPVLRGNRHGLMHLIAHHPLPSLHQGARIDGILEHPGHRGRGPQAIVGGPWAPVSGPLPGLIGGGIGQPQAVEPAGDGPLPHPLDIPLKYARHHRRRLGVRDQGVPVCRVLIVSVGGEGPDKLPPPPLHIQGPPDIRGGFGGIAVIENPIDGNFQPHLHRLGVQKAVHPGTAQGDKPGAVAGKHLLQKIALVRIVPKGPGEGFAHDTVQLPRLHIPDHSLETLPAVIGAG